jgi:hypothetical protein
MTNEIKFVVCGTTSSVNDNYIVREDEARKGLSNPDHQILTHPMSYEEAQDWIWGE